MKMLRESRASRGTRSRYSFKRNGAAKFIVGFNGALAPSSPVAVGDIVQRAITRRVEAQLHEDNNPGTVHVKDGKPLTRIGERMLAEFASQERNFPKEGPRDVAVVARNPRSR